MKRVLALTLVFLFIGSLALAGAPKLSDSLFKSAKQAVRDLAAGDYESLVTDLPFSDVSPSASEWESFAGNFSSLKHAQTEYAVGYWRGSSWSIAVPIQTPSSGDVDTLILTSGDGKHFNGYRYATWASVQKEYSACDHVYWNEEYLGGDATFQTDGNG